MSTKRILLLAGTALATVALAAPAAASAAGQLYHVDTGEAAADETITGSGPLEHNTLGVGLECEAMHGSVQVNANGTGGEASFEVTEETCVAFGFLTGCAIEEATVLNQQMPVTASTEDLDIGDVTIDLHLAQDPEHIEQCEYDKITLFYPSMTGTLLDADGQPVITTGNPIDRITLETEGLIIYHSKNGETIPALHAIHGILFADEPETFGYRHFATG